MASLYSVPSRFSCLNSREHYTPPGKEIKITTGFDARGFEGKYECIWQMQDSNGNDCFPNNEKQFCILFEIKFQSNKQ